MCDQTKFLKKCWPCSFRKFTSWPLRHYLFSSPCICADEAWRCIHFVLQRTRCKFLRSNRWTAEGSRPFSESYKSWAEITQLILSFEHGTFREGVPFWRKRAARNSSICNRRRSFGQLWISRPEGRVGFPENPRQKDHSFLERWGWRPSSGFEWPSSYKVQVISGGFKWFWSWFANLEHQFLHTAPFNSIFRQAKIDFLCKTQT